MQNTITEPLTRTQDLTREGDCKVCHQHFMAGGHWDRERLVELGICPTCDGWMSLVQRRDDPSIVRIDGMHYIIDNSGKGIETLRVIRNGAVIRIQKLWHQGVIPEQFLNVLPDNAVFVRRNSVEIKDLSPRPYKVIVKHR